LTEPEAHVPYITDPRETYVRWTPIGALPEAIVGEIEVRSPEEDRLALILRCDPPAQFDVRIEARGAMIFEVCGEFGSRWQENQVALPKIAGSKAAWPLLEVLESRWLASLSDTRLRHLSREQYRHFELISRGAQVAILASSEPTAHLIPLDSDWND
jgi:hypothetical protein